MRSGKPRSEPFVEQASVSNFSRWHGYGNSFDGVARVLAVLGLKAE